MFRSATERPILSRRKRSSKVFGRHTTMPMESCSVCRKSIAATREQGKREKGRRERERETETERQTETDRETERERERETDRERDDRDDMSCDCAGPTTLTTAF